MSVDSEEIKSENTDELPVVNYKLNLQSKSGRKYRIVGQAMLTEHDITETQPILVFGSVAEPIETLEKVLVVPIVHFSQREGAEGASRRQTCLNGIGLT